MGKLAVTLSLMIARAPEAVAALWFAGRRKIVDGRRIDAKAMALGEMVNHLRVPGQLPSVEASRAGLRRMAGLFDRPCPQSVHRRDTTLPGATGECPARIYDTDLAAKRRPTLLFLHGGGFIQGDLDTHDGLCGQLALEAGIRVIALAYRLAPEHPFPAAPDDVLASYRALRQQPDDWGVDPARLAVGGDSAGGNLAAVLMHDIAVAGLPMPRGQVLIYPVVDQAGETRSMQALATGYVIPRERMAWYADLYIPQGQDRTDPRLSPLRSAHLAGQPPAIIVPAGHDPLWDDGLNHAKALEAAGVAVTVAPYPGQIHVFVTARKVIPQGRDAVSRIARWLREAL